MQSDSATEPYPDLAQVTDGLDLFFLAERERGLQLLAHEPGVDLEPRPQIGLLQVRGAEGRQNHLQTRREAGVSTAPRYYIQVGSEQSNCS